MTSRLYIRRIVADLGDLVLNSITGGKKFEEVDTTYKSLRKKVIALKPILGDPPKFIARSESLWDLWNSYVKGTLKTYESRREFMRTEYFAHYDEKIAESPEDTFEDALVKRDLLLDQPLGSGGFGVVHGATHLVLGQRRAIKRLQPIFADQTDEEKALRRFSREAELLDNLHHKNIVRFFDAGIAAGSPFIVMEFVEGRNLQQIVNDDGPLETEGATEIVRQVAKGLSKAHTADVVHRDLKPTNVMWDETRAVILDFGAGQWLEQILSTRLTSSVVGTMGYIPEELLADPKALHPSIDCFSLGVIFHYLLTGRTPNIGDPTHYLSERSIPLKTRQVILKALAPLKMRYRDGAEMLAAVADTASK
jgi:hypothetical protein